MFIWRIVTAKEAHPAQSPTRCSAGRRSLGNKTDDDDDVIVMRGEHNAKTKQSANEAQRARHVSPRTKASRLTQHSLECALAFANNAHMTHIQTRAVRNWLINYSPHVVTII
jgi:hypothetical protein